MKGTYFKGALGQFLREANSSCVFTRLLQKTDNATAIILREVLSVYTQKMYHYE